MLRLHKKEEEHRELDKQLAIGLAAQKEQRAAYEEVTSSLREEKQELSTRLNRATEQERSLAVELRLLREEYNKLLEERGTLVEQLKSQFATLSHDILEERSRAFREKNDEAIAPIREDLKRFYTDVDRLLKDASSERIRLESHIEHLYKQAQEVGAQTDKLALALKGDSKIQGDWGEMILERILEESGLEKGREYEMQVTLKDEAGHAISDPEQQKQRLRPDAIVYFPDGKKVVIDAKVSLKAYTEAMEATSEAEKEAAYTQHLESVYRHIKELSNRAYASHIKDASPYVLMFIPNESAYITAMHRDPNLWQNAFAQNVMIVNGMNLMSSLRLIREIWSRDKQDKNVEKIVAEVIKLYDKMAVFVEGFSQLELRIERLREEYSKSKRQLIEGSGNILRRFNSIRELGKLETKRQLPEGD